MEKSYCNLGKRKFWNYCIILKKDKHIYYSNNLIYNIEIHKNYLYLINKDVKIKKINNFIDFMKTWETNY